MAATLGAHVPAREMDVQTQSGWERAQWAVMRAAMSSVGQLSDGVRIGYRSGFDSGVMLDYVYENRARGSLLVGALIDRVYLNAVGWRAIRARRVLLTHTLYDIVTRNREAGVATRVLDVAAGPGRYLHDVLRLVGADAGDVRVLCRDLAPEGLAHGQALGRTAGLANIRYELGDAFNPAPTDAALGGVPNVIVVSGLYELMLDDDLIRRSLARLRAMLVPGGVLVFTTQVRHPQLQMIANVLPNRDGEAWVMHCRTQAQVEGWAHAAGFGRVHSRYEEVGLFAVTTATNG